MDEIPLAAQFIALAVLLVCSAFFSMAETAMMASNRIRLRHLAQEGHRGAGLAVALLGKTDQLLGVILLGIAMLIEEIHHKPTPKPDHATLPDEQS